MRCSKNGEKEVGRLKGPQDAQRLFGWLPWGVIWLPECQADPLVELVPLPKAPPKNPSAYIHSGDVTTRRMISSALPIHSNALPMTFNALGVGGIAWMDIGSVGGGTGIGSVGASSRRQDPGWPTKLEVLLEVLGKFMSLIIGTLGRSVKRLLSITKRKE